MLQPFDWRFVALSEQAFPVAGDTVTKRENYLEENTVSLPMLYQLMRSDKFGGPFIYYARVSGKR